MERGDWRAYGPHGSTPLGRWRTQHCCRAFLVEEAAHKNWEKKSHGVISNSPILEAPIPTRKAPIAKKCERGVRWYGSG